MTTAATRQILTAIAATLTPTTTNNNNDNKNGTNHNNNSNGNSDETNNNNNNNSSSSSSRWRVDYPADISVGMNSIEGWEFKTKLILDEMGNRFPLVLYMEKPSSARRSPESSVRRNPNQLMLLACKKVPKQVRLALHPGAFSPRRTTAGWVTDPQWGRHMWLP